MARARIENIEELSSVYFLYGDEELLIEEALGRIKRLFLEQTDSDFNLETLDAWEAGAERIIDCAETPPLISSRRLVTARNVGKLSRSEQEKLAKYIIQPNPSTCLVLVADCLETEKEKVKRSLRKAESSLLFEAVQKCGVVFKYSFPTRRKKDSQAAWVSEQFKKRGKKVTMDAIELLFEKTGHDLRDLKDAIERICLYWTNVGEIRKEHVDEIVISSAEKGIFELVDAVAERRRDLSLYILNKLIEQGESPYTILGILLRQFRLISRVNALSRENDRSEISRIAGIPPFLVAKCLQQGKRFNQKRLKKIFQQFRNAYSELHAGSYLGQNEYERSVLEVLIVRIIG